MIKFLLILIISLSAFGAQTIKDNTLKVGKKDGQDIYIFARTGAANEPYIFFDFSESKWKQSNDGTTEVGFGNLDNVTNDAQLKRAAGDLNTFTEKTEPVDGDIVILEDSEDSYNKKKVQLTNLIAGSGGGSFQWQLGDIAPIEEFDNKLDVLSFSQSTAAEIHAMAVVPVKYRVGDQIQLIGSKVYTSASSGNILMKTQTTLLQNGDIVTSLTNQHTSTNTELTVSAANTLIQTGNIDLTDSSGQINSVAVQPGDVLIIRFYRDFGSETTSVADFVKFIEYSSSVSFKP